MELTIHVKWGAKALTVKIGSGETLLALKKILQEQTGIAPDLQKIMYKGQLKGDEKTMSELKVVNNSKFMLLGAALKEVMAVVTAQETSKVGDLSDNVKSAELPKGLPAFWNLPPFTSSLLDPFLENFALNVKRGDVISLFDFIFKKIVRKAQDVGSRDVVGLFLFSNEDVKHLVDVATLVENSIEWTQEAQEAGDPEKFMKVLEGWKEKLNQIKIGQQILVPGGWEGLNSYGTIFHIVHRTSSDTFSFVTCSPFGGLEYHQQGSSEIPKLKYKTCLVIDGIPGNRIKNLAFWSTLFSLWIKNPPSEYHRVEVIYDVLLPWLSEKSVTNDGVEITRSFSKCIEETQNNEAIDYRTKCRSAGSTGIRSIWEAVRYLLRLKGLSSAQMKQLSFVFRKECLLRSGEELITRFASKYDTANEAIKSANQIGIIPDPDDATPDSAESESGLENFSIVYSFLSSKTLIKNNGSTVDVKSLNSKKKVIGLYFSASWCGPCQSFTQQLVQTYNALQKQGKEFEIIFISLDRDEESFKKYFKEMPWLALPYEFTDTRKRLESVGKVKGIPTLFLYNSNGTLLSKNGKKVILDDTEGTGFPWDNANKPNLDNAFKKLTNLINKKGSKVTRESLVNKVVGLYFSASWCSPCQSFTPVLKNVYKTITAEQGKDFEIIFVSADKDKESFQKYFSEMPWLAISFEDAQSRADLSHMFHVKGIPTLILFDSKGNFLTDQGRKVIGMDQQGQYFPWKDLHDLEEAAGVADEKNPVLTLRDVEFLTIACQQLALSANKENSSGRMDGLRLRQNKRIIDAILDLINVVPKEKTPGGLPPRLDVELNVDVSKFSNTEMVVTKDMEVPSVEHYAGRSWTPHHPVVVNLLSVPNTVSSVSEVFQALEHCNTACNRMLERAAQSGTSSRTVLQIQVIALITTFFLEVIPPPPPRDHGPETKSIWLTDKFTREQQSGALDTLLRLALMFASMWQGIEHPTRGFDSERSLVAMAILALFDFIIREKPENPTFLTDLLSEDGGYQISSTACPNQRNFEEVATTMELVNPAHTKSRCLIIDYLTSIRRVTRHTIFPFRQEEIITEESQPTFSIEILKHGSDVVFMRKLLQRHNLQLDFMTGTPEMVTIMHWFTGPKSALAKEAPEFGLMRDMAAIYKFLVTMQTRESELMQRCAGKGNMSHWSKCLSADDSYLNAKTVRTWSATIPSLKWELANVRGYDLNMADLICRFGERVLYFGEGSVVHSPANLSAIIERPRPSEDDVLHSTKLPNFGDTFRREESEMLLSYLSVEYARIPLVVGFFASRERTTYLFNPQLRELLRATLFEGGTWVSPTNKGTVEQIPVRKTYIQHEQWKQKKLLDVTVKDEINVLGTPEGNLLNELHCSPSATLDPLLIMVHAIKDLRNSTVHSADASFTIFLMELTIDIQSYIAYAVKQEEKVKEQIENDPTLTWDSCYGSAKNLEVLRQYYNKFDMYLQKDIAPILLRWKQEATKDGDRVTLCVVHSYLALLWSHPLEFNQETVIALLGHIGFVRNKHGFGLRRGRSDLMWSHDDEDMTPKDRLLRFLQAYGVDTLGMGDSALEDYINMNKKGPLILRVGHQSVIVPPLHRIQNIEELPPADVPEDRIFSLLQVQRRALVNWFEENPTILDETLNAIMKIALDNPDFNAVGWVNAQDGWLESTEAQIKFDVQSTEIFWRNDVLKPVPDSMTQFNDFKTLWDRTQFQCGLVRRDQNRHWVNLMDVPYELQEWTAEDLEDQGIFCPKHTPSPVPEGEKADPNDPGSIRFLDIDYCRPFELYSDVPHPILDERWATEFLRPILLQIYPPMEKMSYKLLLPKETLKKESNVCRLVGREIIEDENEKGETVGITWKEVVIYRDPLVVNVYNIISHGRRMWRSQIYSSNLKFSLQSLSPDEAVLRGKSSPPNESANAGGDYKQSVTHSPSLVIIHRNNLLKGTEFFVPARLLYGIIPSVLIEIFYFWQGEDGIIRGEPHVSSQWFAYRLEISFEHINGETHATVVRFNSQSTPTEIKRKDSSTYDQTGFLSKSAKTTRNTIDSPELIALLSQGFGREQSINALQNNDNDVQRSVEYLLDSSTKEERAEEDIKTTSDSSYTTVGSIQSRNTNEMIDVLENLGYSRVAAQYSLELNQNDIDQAQEWLVNPTNDLIIKNLNLKNPTTVKEGIAELYLSCLLNVPKGSVLYRIGQILTRIENLSHILIWTNTSDLSDLRSSAHQEDNVINQIAIIELPRLKVKFQPKQDENGQIRLYLLEQSGWFISDSNSEFTKEQKTDEMETEEKIHAQKSAKFLSKILVGLENFLVLENSSRELQLFVPNFDVFRPKSSENPFNINLLYNRSSIGWQQVMESRYYLYPVHTSMTFLLMPSLAATLYMAVHRFLLRQYSDCFKLLASSVDTDFTSEEGWIFEQFLRGSNDCHPDSHACRLKASLCILYSENKIDWKVHDEMLQYIQKLNHVSADCTLNFVEELDILDNCPRANNVLRNRKLYIEQVIGRNESVNLEVSPVRLAGQPWLKLTSASREYMEAHGQPTTRIQYDTPGPGILKDADAFKIIWEEKVISGEENGPIGWCYLYELLRGDFKMILLEEDVSFSLGEILTRYVQLKSARWGREVISDGEREYEGSWQMVELATMINFSSSDLRASSWPEIPKDGPSQDLLKVGCNIYRINSRERLPLKHAFLDIIGATTRLIMGTNDYHDRMKNFSNDLKITREYAENLSKIPTVIDYNIVQNQRKRINLKKAGRSKFILTPSSLFSIVGKDKTNPIDTTEEDVRSLVSQPLSIINLNQFVVQFKQTTAVLEEIPFDVKDHPMAQSIVAKDMLERVNKDVKCYANQVRDKTIPCIIGLLEENIKNYANGTENSDQVFLLLSKLIIELESIIQRDQKYIIEAIERAIFIANYIELPEDVSEESTKRCRFLMEKFGRQKSVLDISTLSTALLDEDGLSELISVNPYIKNPEEILVAVANVMFLVSRVNQANKAITDTKDVKSLLIELNESAKKPKVNLRSSSLLRQSSQLSDVDSVRRKKSKVISEDDSLVNPVDETKNDLIQRLYFGSKNLASSLLCGRYYTHKNNDNTYEYDPRFLVFEYVFNILLRKRQVEMVNSFMDSIEQDASRVQQMIMGAGKTTVVGPLLTLMLANGKQLVTHVMPTALLEQSRNILRNRFSSIMVKSIYTLNFERAVEDSEDIVKKLWKKLNSAVLNHDVVVAAPESLKSVALKFIEQLHSIEIFSNSESSYRPGKDDRTNREYMELQKQMILKSDMADSIVQILDTWKNGVLIMDEVDVLLHPLKSELNFPIGMKEAIDLAGIRWDLPIHLIDALFYYSNRILCSTTSTEIFSSAEKKLGILSVYKVLEDICYIIDQGYEVHALQRNPHVVLLDNQWYDRHLREKMAIWAFVGIYRHIEKDGSKVPTDIILQYIASSGDKSVHRSILEENLYPESLKLLNLASDWVTSLFPHCFSKINRVAYGILSPEDIVIADPRTPQSRLLMAVPFVGKDVPSRSSEFAHPDALIGLTVMAYRYEGLRLEDLGTLMGQLKKDYSSQVGPREQRPASVLFRSWLTNAQKNYSRLGRSVEDISTISLKSSTLSNSAKSVDTRGGNILPLSLFQPGDKKQLRSLFKLVRLFPDIILYYLRQHVFPACLNFQATKVSACGHELGSNILFSKRIGFSGTPSNLLPKDLGDCEYEPGSDGKIINTLTSEIVTTYTYLDSDWNAKKLLNQIVNEPNPVHCLIDTGALITGMSNQEVAHYLLLHLPIWFEGVVYLDRNDRQMILLRSSGRSMLLSQCGVSPDKRFSFYDQVHTTGMDIKQATSARAVLTLGKDMTFRDYAQGAYRMRGIGNGQSIHLYIIPEVRNLIEEELSMYNVSDKKQLNLSQDSTRPTKKVKTEISVKSTSKKQNENNDQDNQDIVVEKEYEKIKTPEEHKKVLLDVPSWLFINSMRMETLQYVKLCSQELYNVWRKRAIGELVDEVKLNVWNGTQRDAERLGRFRTQFNTILSDCISLFREPLGFSIPSVVPTREHFHQKLTQLSKQYQIFTKDRPDLAERIDQILSNLGSVELQDIDMDQQNRDAHVVREQEQEAQEEAEEEAEQEEERESKFSRQDEQPNPWAVDLLSKVPTLIRGEEAFYPFKEFQVRKEMPLISFPNNLLLSDNFFRPSWISTGDRRLKNVTFVMEWIISDVKSNNSDIDSNEMEQDKKPSRFICAVSLSEGETLRRLIHIHHPALKNISLALYSLESGLVDTTPNFTPQNSSENDVAICMQALNFINCEMYYEPEQLELLEKALSGSSLPNRKEFFLSCLRLRRHERNLWEDTPIAKIFTPQEEWHLIRARSMLNLISLAITKAIKNRKIPSPWWNPREILSKHDTDKDGFLRKDELLTAFDEMDLENFSAADYNEVAKLFPKDEKGSYEISSFCETLSIMSNDEIESILVQKMYSGNSEKENNKEKWECKVCSYGYNPKWVVVCDACGHDLIGKPVIKLSDGEWSCGKCSLRNKKRDWFCDACWNARPTRF